MYSYSTFIPEFSISPSIFPFILLNLCPCFVFFFFTSPPCNYLSLNAYCPLPSLLASCFFLPVNRLCIALVLSESIAFVTQWNVLPSIRITFTQTSYSHRIETWHEWKHTYRLPAGYQINHRWYIKRIAKKRHKKKLETIINQIKGMKRFFPSLYHIFAAFLCFYHLSWLH